MTKPAENPTKLSSQIFYFWNFITEIFRRKVFFSSFFQKPQKEAILFCKFLHENWADRKNGVHHDKANGKSFETVISDFLFLKLCHRDFSPQSNVKNHDFIKKLVQFSIFSGHPLVYLIKFNQSTIRAWTNKKDPMHFGAS